MKRKIKIFRNFRNKYRLSILNDETFEEVWQYRLSRMNVIIAVGGFAIFLIIMVSVLIAFTPLREFIPGYPDGETRKGYVKNALRADSLERVLKQWENYYANINTILNGGVPLTIESKADTVKPSRTVEYARSKEDSLLRNQIEADQMYNLSFNSSGNTKTNTFFFIPPVKGIVTNRYSPLQNHYGIDLVAAPNEVVLAVAKGTVILADWTIETGYTIAVQHENNFISVYKHNSKLLKRQGDVVGAGDAIAIIGNSGELTTGPHLHFEMWQNGNTLDPSKFIHF
ncbi:MAG: M23 family metallopeptidase [Bacteroidales bacterium]|nr:M23 family metallopeptidase [Bacteroidales bacterium]HOW20916.1 M23 family metallopeptidase [Tenuifilaceae bacterium]